MVWAGKKSNGIKFDTHFFFAFLEQKEILLKHLHTMHLFAFNDLLLGKPYLQFATITGVRLLHGKEERLAKLAFVCQGFVALSGTPTL